MAGDHRTVHLVHCDSNDLLSLYDVLAGTDYLVAASTNALDALVHIVRRKPRAVLCHWEMPEMNGAEFIERVRRASPESRVVMSSRQADGALYELVLRAGANDLLREPYNPLDVIRAVSRMLDLTVPYLATDPITGNGLAAGADERERRWK